MRGRSSRQAGSVNGGMDHRITKIEKLKDEQPHLSGAYIRSLVKQLTSSRTTKDPPSPGRNGDSSFPSDHHHHHQPNSSAAEAQPSQPAPPPHKKQVRRRLHTTRPYQERLLNMAEARREIVTALKFHRAAMKQANEQQQTPPPSQAPPTPLAVQEGKVNYLENFPFSTAPCCSSQNPHSWQAAVPQIPPPAIADNLNNLPLPDQTLGLNLNFHDFNNLETSTLYLDSSNPLTYSPYSSPSPSSSSSAAVAAASLTSGTDQQVPNSVDDVAEHRGVGLHAAMDDEEMAEIRSIGEKHQMEWNDTMNLVTSAWWFKFLKNSETGEEQKQKGENQEQETETDGYRPFEEVVEFPAWMNIVDDDGCCCLQQRYSNDHCLDDDLQDPALPCVDIGEIEGMDAEWLA